MARRSRFHVDHHLEALGSPVDKKRELAGRLRSGQTEGGNFTWAPRAALAATDHGDYTWAALKALNTLGAAAKGTAAAGCAT